MTDDDIDDLDALYTCSDPQAFSEVHNFGEAVIEKWPAIREALRELTINPADEEQRWKWVLSEVGLCVPALAPVRHENPRDRDDMLEHLRWLTSCGPTCGELDGNWRKAARWACWAQGAAVALGLMALEDGKRLNMRASWLDHKAACE
jgi:hypothetical protein